MLPRLGEQRASEGAYVWKALWKTGAVVTNGTDVPVEEINPIASFHCSVMRNMVGTDSAFFTDQKLSREQALRTYTVNDTVARLVRDGGLNAIDVGPLERARQLEAVGFLGIILQARRGTRFGTAGKLVMPAKH